jgi:hypothetical protein
MLPYHRLKTIVPINPKLEPPESVSQNKPFLFLSWLSHVFYYSDRKLTLMRTLKTTIGLWLILFLWWNKKWRVEEDFWEDSKCLGFITLTNSWVSNPHMTEDSGSHSGVLQGDWEGLLKPRSLGPTSGFLTQ